MLWPLYQLWQVTVLFDTRADCSVFDPAHLEPIWQDLRSLINQVSLGGFIWSEQQLVDIYLLPVGVHGDTASLEVGLMPGLD